jgi:hypothetical protein
MPVHVDSEVYHQPGIEMNMGLLRTALRFRFTLGQTPTGGCVFFSHLRHCIRFPIGLAFKVNDHTLIHPP